MSVKAVIDEDRKVSVLELESRIGVNRGTIDVVLKDKTENERLLRTMDPQNSGGGREDRINRVAASSNFLKRAKEEGDTFLTES